MTGGAQPYGRPPFPAPSPGPAGSRGSSGKTSALATVSLVLSILGVPVTVGMVGVVLRLSSGLAALGLVSLALAPATGLAGAIVGHVALGRIRRTGQRGRGRAIAGIVVGWLTVLLFVLLALLIVALVYQRGR